MAILLNNNSASGNAEWQKALASQLPGMPVYTYPNIPDPEAVRYALVWNHPKGDLKRYPNLRSILSLGAGMEHLLSDPELPEVPLVSLGDPAMAREMSNYALYWVMNAHRHYPQYRSQQNNQYWQPLDVTPAERFNVVVLGLGRIACEVARTVQQAGFNVKAWDFKPKTAEGIDTYSGMEALPTLLKPVDVVICCLALNSRSEQLINAAFLKLMPRKSHLVNISRGAIVDEAALLQALDKVQISSAALDVFSAEPLPKESRLWRHPKVAITPHIAGPTQPETAVRVIAANIMRMEQGELPEPIFDRSRGM
ncbi:2-hydroxyacid dehydrogenase [Leucothrix mucor]|uniref:2-hydroxyacid dehydrogenase n=1 Tax=Leucothrix mucor TaxID=45248 RepID=UPI0003B5CAD6|nr:glyoxylate/hydroxypyruvate reductase A [Leucothrix mucor]